MNRDTLIMLDLDGTIIDTSRLYLQGVPMVVKRHLGLSIGKRDILPLWGQFAKNFFSHFAHAAGLNSPERVEAMYADFCDYYNAHHNRLTTVYAGVNASLEAMAKMVRAIGVVTTRPSSRSAGVLKMPWVRYIDFFVWGDCVPRNKPFPDGLESAMKLHASDGGRCIYVGDNAHDIAAARACRRRVVSVAALWGAMDPAGLAAAKPDHSFATFTDFADWVLQGGPGQAPQARPTRF